MSGPVPGGPDCLCASPAPSGHWSLCPVAKLAQELADLQAKHREVEAARDAALAQLREREEVARLGSTVRPPLAPGAGS